MPTEAVGVRLKSAFVVLTAIDEFKTRALTKLEARPVASDQPDPHFREVLGSLSGQLNWAYTDLFNKDTAYIHELAGDAGDLKVRDESAAGGRRVLVRARTIFDGCYEPDNIEEYGFPRNVAQDPELLYQQFLHLNQRLSEPDLGMPEPLDEELAVEPSVLVRVLAPWSASLEDALRRVRAGRRKLQLASLQRNDALEFFDQTFIWVARTAESLFSLAGEKELAKRIRTSTSRPGRTVEDPAQLIADAGQEPPDFDQVDPDQPLPGNAPDAAP